MTFRQVLLRLLLLTVIVGMGIGIMVSYSPFQPYIGFSWTCLVFFFVLTLLILWGGSITAVSSNRNSFSQVVMLSVLAKMLCSLGLLLIYSKTAHPPTKLFLIPFFALYLIYTIFEIILMMELGKLKKVP